MSPKQLEESIFRTPYVPLRISLDDGESFVLGTPGRGIVTADKLLVGVSSDPCAPPEQRRLRIILLSRVRSVETIKLADGSVSGD
ncbi:MAG: hypothetical protein ACAI43_15295 [Phycisphaerae bacterium]|nr:hypothetical protein [Tepidisphaeraceae bacterium]